MSGNISKILFSEESDVLPSFWDKPYAALAISVIACALISYVPCRCELKKTSFLHFTIQESMCYRRRHMTWLFTACAVLWVCNDLCLLGRWRGNEKKNNLTGAHCCSTFSHSNWLCVFVPVMVWNEFSPESLGCISYFNPVNERQTEVIYGKKDVRKKLLCDFTTRQTFGTFSAAEWIKTKKKFHLRHVHKMYTQVFWFMSLLTSCSQNFASPSVLRLVTFIALLHVLNTILHLSAFTQAASLCQPGNSKDWLKQYTGRAKTLDRGRQVFIIFNYHLFCWCFLSQSGWHYAFSVFAIDF